MFAPRLLTHPICVRYYLAAIARGEITLCDRRVEPTDALEEVRLVKPFLGTLCPFSVSCCLHAIALLSC